MQCSLNEVARSARTKSVPADTMMNIISLRQSIGNNGVLNFHDCYSAIEDFSSRHLTVETDKFQAVA